MLEEELGLAKQTFDNPKAVGVTIFVFNLLKVSSLYFMNMKNYH